MTTKFLRSWAMAGLVFLGCTAVAGAWFLLITPEGAPAGLPLSLLQHTPFHSYLVPGIVLLTVNGLLSFLVLFFLIRRVRNYEFWVVLQGIVLTTWLLAEIAWLQMFVWEQGVYFGVAALLIVSGWALLRRHSELPAV